MLENQLNWTISSQATKLLVEGSTTNLGIGVGPFGIEAQSISNEMMI